MLRWVVIVVIGLLSAPAFAAPELASKPIEADASRADTCNPKVVTRGLNVPVLLAADAKGRVFSVDSTVDSPRVVRIRQVGVAKPIAQLTGEYYDGVLFGAQLILRGSDELVVVELASGKQHRVAKRVSSLASHGTKLYAIRIDDSAAHVNELVLPTFEEKEIATVPGRWAVVTHLAATAGSLLVYLYPDAADSSATRSAFEANLVQISLDKSKVTQLGVVHIGTALGASSTHGFAASLTHVARVDDSGSATLAPLYGTHAIVADDKLSVWANVERDVLVAWPAAGKPFVVCDHVGGAVQVAITASHIYYMTTPVLPNVTKPTGVIGRFTRPR